MFTLSTPKTDAFRLRFNPEGLLLYVILFAIGFAAYNTGNNLLFLIISVMATLYGMHSVLNLISRHGNEVERRVPRTIFAGESFEVEVRITNRKRFFASYSLVAWEEESDLQQKGRVHFVRIKPGETLVRRYQFIASRRGALKFNRIWLQCRYPFGLTQHSIAYALPDEVVVYPRLIAVPSPQAIRQGRNGNLELRQKGFGFNLYNLRQYQQGESSRLIHWKTSARRDQLMVKEFENEEQRQVTLVFENTGKSESPVDDIFEHYVSRTASYASQFIREGWQVELVTLDESIPPGTGSGHLRHILYHLALIQPANLSSSESERILMRALPVDGGRVVWIGRESDISPSPAMMGGAA